MKNKTTNAILDLFELLFLGFFYFVSLTILFGMFLGDAISGIIATFCFTIAFSVIVHFLRKDK